MISSTENTSTFLIKKHEDIHNKTVGRFHTSIGTNRKEKRKGVFSQRLLFVFNRY